MTADPLPFWRRPVYATRKSAHVLFAAVIWPALTLLGTAVTLLNNPYVAIGDGVAVEASLAALALSLPETVLAGTIVFGISAFVFSRFGPETAGKHFGFARLVVEPLLVFLAIVAGMAISYPAVLGLPLLRPLSRLPAAVVITLLMTIVAIGSAFAARPRRRLRLSMTLIALGVLSPAPLMARAALEPYVGHPSDVVVLGIDSVSHSDDIAPLKTWTAARSGVWYEYPVAPGLLTNAVWSSILTMKPVSAHHVFHTFERLAMPATFLSAARAKGFYTVAIFPDQVTCAVGSRAGFDEDRSGPVGWRQLLLPALANNSFLLPIVRPVFPRIWPLTSPSNQAGTFTYDVRRDIRGILRAGARGRRTLVAAHLTYIHLASYPSSFDLSWPEIGDLARAPARLIEDRSFDWQDVDRPADPIKLQRWKLDFLQRVLREEVDAAHYLEEGRELVLFSDHGHRRGLSEYSFRDERYHRVLLATFGRPARCPRDPISLIDIGALLGFSDYRSEPVVEFAMAPLEIWPKLMNSAKLQFAGDVELDGKLLDQVFAGLLKHRPWPDHSSVDCGAMAAVR